MDKNYKEVADDKTKKFLELWQRRFAEDKKTWKETMERMHEREKYLTVNDDVLLSDNIAHKLNAQVLLDLGEMDQQIYTRENDVQDELNRIKTEGIKADREYIDITDEIEKCKEQLRQQRYNNDIRHKYIYQNLMSDKVDFWNKNPNSKLRLPPRKVLGGNQYDYDISTKPSTTDYIQNPCKFDFDYKHLVSSRSERSLDAATLPLGRQFELGADPQHQMDSLDKQLFEWNLKQEAKGYDRGDVESSYQRHSVIPHELKGRSDYKTTYLM